MKKYKNLQQYLEQTGNTRENIKENILQTALDLLGDCAHNFDGDAAVTEKASLPLEFLNEIIDNVE